MASLVIGSLCKPASIYFSGILKPPSSLATVSKPEAYNFYKKRSMKFEQMPCNHMARFTPHIMHKNKFKLDAASTDNPGSDDLMNPMETAIGFLGVLYRFIRPYSALGTVLNVASMSLLAVEKLSDVSPLFVMKALQALVGGIFMQMFVCGYNQICDIELDKVNKPFLPIAAGELSMRNAILVSWLSAIMVLKLLSQISYYLFKKYQTKIITGLSSAWIVGSAPLFWGFFGWFVVGIAYSANVLPLLRWKRFPLTAAFYMLVDRVLVVPVGYYMHIKNYLHGTPSLFSRPTLFAAGMLSVFSIAIIFFKDIPDIKGDQMHGIKSLASRLGEKRMFWSCIWLIEMSYVAASIMGATSTITWSKYVTIIGHVMMASLLWIRAKSVDLKSKESVQSMYMFLWQLFYAEYCLIPCVR